MTVATFVGVVLWILYTVYQAIVTPPITEVNPALLTPITSELDTPTLASISARRQMKATLDAEFAAIPTPMPTEAPKR